MTVTELKKKCDGMIADGFGDSEIYLCRDLLSFGYHYFPLENGFSSVAYNEGAKEQIFEDIENGLDGEVSIDEADIDTGRYVILN